MAAGPQNGSRKRFSNHSEEDNYSYKKRFDRSELQKRSDGRTNDVRRNRFVDGEHGIHQFGHKLHDRNLVDRNREHNISEKKRKFSPILWDKDEKQQVRISSKNRIQDTVEDAKIQRVPVAADCKLQISSVESIVSNVSDDLETCNSLVSRTPEDHYHDHDQEHEDGEFVEERKLSKSKWAFNDSPKKEQYDNNSSPESGEFKRDGSDANDDVSSLSSEDQLPVNVSSDGYISSENDDDGDDDDCGMNMIPSCRNVFEYERLGKISEGTYGVVYKARDKKTGEIVALKKVKMGKERDGFPITALREINILRSIQHPSVVELKEVVTDEFDGVYMVMEYIDNELKSYMDRIKQPFSQSEVKRLMIQLLEGLSHIHDDWVIHRDLKTSNLLLNKNGELKICDFGMARTHGSPTKSCTSLVVTLWYRAPELLLGMKNYTTAIDMWSVGCIMAELLSKKPLFDGNRELEQVDKIFRTLGTPNDSIWPGYSKLPGVKSNFVKQPFNALRKKFPLASFTGAPSLTELGFDLLSKFLTYDPKKRITAEEALNHGWFRESPLPAENVRICK